MLHSRALGAGSNSSITPRSNGWGNTTSFWRASVGGTPLTNISKPSLPRKFPPCPAPLFQRRPAAQKKMLDARPCQESERRPCGISQEKNSDGATLLYNGRHGHYDDPNERCCSAIEIRDDIPANSQPNPARVPSRCSTLDSIHNPYSGHRGHRLNPPLWRYRGNFPHHEELCNRRRGHPAAARLVPAVQPPALADSPWRAVRLSSLATSPSG
jgi:hypothetical protein